MTTNINNSSISNTKWLIIARNEYQMILNRIPKIKPYFPFIAVGTLLLYLVYLAPAIADILIEDAYSILFSYIAVAMIEIYLLIFFIVLITFQMSLAVREIKTGFMELYIKAPIKSSDLLLGEFFGKYPFYAIGITLFVGIFIGLLSPLNLDFFQVALIVLIFIINFTSAIWIGNLFSIMLRSRLAKSSRGRDIGKALAILIVLPSVILIYAVLGGAFDVLQDPNANQLVKDILRFFPSSWGSKIIIDLVNNPGEISAMSTEAIFQLIALVFFFIFTLWFGVKIANRIYNLEPTSFGNSKAKPDGIVYNFVKRLGGNGSFGSILVYNFKNYVRKFENLSKLFYGIGLMVVMLVFLVNINEFDSEFVYMIAQIFSVIIALFVVAEITIQGKENLLIYKKTPLGENKFLLGKLVQYWITVVPLTIIFGIILTIQIPDVTQEDIFRNIIFIGILASAIVILAMGIFLLNPAYNDKAPETMINMQILAMGPSMIFLGLLIFIGRFDSFYDILIPHVSIMWIIAITIFLLGKKKLSNIE